jgi:hypothetical protein
MSAPFTDPSDLLPALQPRQVLGQSADYVARPIVSGRVTAWNAVTRANSVTVLGSVYTNLPVCTAAEPSLAAGITVLCVPFGDTYAIVDRLRIP